MGIASFLSRTSPIKSIQYGTVSITGTNTSGTATITSVSTAKTVLQFLGWTTDASVTDNQRRWHPRITLTDATTVTANRNSGATGYDCTVSFAVVEYY